MQEEQKQIKRDVLSTLAWNGFFLVLLFVLYYINQANGLVDHLFARFLNF